MRFMPSLDIFNLSNANTIQAIRGTQNGNAATNANQIQAIWLRASCASASVQLVRSLGVRGGEAE